MSSTSLSDSVLALKKRSLVISLDYDNCGILIASFQYFELMLKIFGRMECPPEVKEKYKCAFFSAREKLQNFIDEKVARGSYDEVILMVGSNRQSRNLDESNDYGNSYRLGGSAGLCCENYPLYVEQRNELNPAGPKWIFHPFSFYDEYFKREVGYAFSVESLSEVHPFSGIFHPNKVDLLKYQMKHLRSIRPDNQIDFIFIDDYPTKDHMEEKHLEAFSDGVFVTDPSLNIHMECHKFDFMAFFSGEASSIHDTDLVGPRTLLSVNPLASLGLEKPFAVEPPVEVFVSACASGDSEDETEIDVVGGSSDENDEDDEGNFYKTRSASKRARVESLESVSGVQSDESSLDVDVDVDVEDSPRVPPEFLGGSSSVAASIIWGNPLVVTEPSLSSDALPAPARGETNSTALGGRGQSEETKMPDDEAEKKCPAGMKRLRELPYESYFDASI